MKFTVTIDRDEDNVWIVECPAIPGCVTQGTSKDEALVNIREAIKLCLEVRAELLFPILIRKPPAVFAGSIPPVMSFSGE